MGDLIAASESDFVARSNLLRGHLALDGMTPAHATIVGSLLDEGWTDLVPTATKNRTDKET